MLNNSVEIPPTNFMRETINGKTMPLLLNLSELFFAYLIKSSAVLTSEIIFMCNKKAQIILIALIYHDPAKIPIVPNLFPKAS